MKDFYSFIQNEMRTLAAPDAGSSGPSDQRSLVARTALALEDADVPKDKALRFGHDLAKLVASESFLKELSQEIREPGLTESEDEFVLRCRVAMKKLLNNHLK